MRRLRRRCPAGVPQVPINPPPPWLVATPIEPAIVRLAPDRTVLDPLWGLAAFSLALVWPDERTLSGWARVVWPVDSVSRYPVAPVDLHVGHVLEVSAWRAGQWRAAYGWIADVDDHRFVVAPSDSAAEAVGIAGRAFVVWRAAELVEVEDAWRERFGHARRFRNRTS